MIEIIIAVFILLLLILYMSNSTSAMPANLTVFTSNISIPKFDVLYAAKRSQLSIPRLTKNKKDPYAVVLFALLAASNSGKSVLPYKDLPANPQIYDAFKDFNYNPDHFFGELIELSAATTPATFAPNQSNVSNLGLQIVNYPTKTSQYNPKKGGLLWTHMQKSSK